MLSVARACIAAAASAHVRALASWAAIQYAARRPLSKVRDVKAVGQSSATGVLAIEKPPMQASSMSHLEAANESVHRFIRQMRLSSDVESIFADEAVRYRAFIAVPPTSVLTLCGSLACFFVALACFRVRNSNSSWRN